MSDIEINPQDRTMDTTLNRIIVSALAFIATAAAAADFHVAPNGNDTNPGTQAKPFATLSAARDAARSAGAGPHRIVVLPGDFFLAKTLELDARDNGLTIEAAESGKVKIYGGKLVTGWRQDGEKFWCADLPGVKEGTWDFRALVVNGQMPERARLPETGTFTHKNEWKGARYISGAWDPKPTQEQLTTVLYDSKDIPVTLDMRNAEIRVLHMWNESLYGIARNDTQRNAFVLSSPTIHPPGAFGVKKYVIFNTREGMTRPGQWYLDRSAGRLVYWPLPGEDMAKARVIAPRLERIIHIAGTARQPVEKITLRGLGFQATTTPLGARSFGATGFWGAVDVERSWEFKAERLEIRNVGGEGIALRVRNQACQILDCHVHHTGACGVEVEVTGSGSSVSRNHIHHVGLNYPSAISLSANGSGLHIHRNEIHDGPYSGIVCNPGDNYRIEENLIYRVMQQMHDGAAIYGHLTKSVLRGNMVKDIVEQGKGYGASAYYLDEQSCDSIVERNVAIGVPMPTHNHISRNLVYRDNVFITDKDMSVSFAKCAGCTFERNTLFAPGKITINQPNAIKLWTNNVVFREGLGKDDAPQAFTISDAMPPVTPPTRRTSPVVVVRVAQPPALDGEVGADEWPGDGLGLDREPSRWPASGVPVGAELCYDDQCLYVAISAGLYQINMLRTGTAWGKDDGAEICIAGQTADGKPATFIIHGFAGGALQSVTDAGAPAAAADRLGKAVRFAVSKWRHGWRGEWAIPWDALGLKPAPGLKVAFNIGVFRSEDGVWRCWEGTLAENWRLDQAGVLLFR
ncbi:MAG: right-handed parallel beta-helix repeat-containing protein [Limisphaerales bacterium]